MYSSIDHIDPRWEEGRDYQLVCGLDVESNLQISNGSDNVSKSNRFLPYRGESPVNEGDYTYFLDIDTGEWVYEQFLGDWWMDKTTSLCGPGQPSTENGRRLLSEKMKGRTFTQESKDKMSLSHTGMKKEWVIETNKREYSCPHCDKIIRSKGNLTQHLRAKHNG